MKNNPNSLVGNKTSANHFTPGDLTESSFRTSRFVFRNCSRRTSESYPSYKLKDLKSKTSCFFNVFGLGNFKMELRMNYFAAYDINKDFVVLCIVLNLSSFIKTWD